MKLISLIYLWMVQQKTVLEASLFMDSYIVFALSLKMQSVLTLIKTKSLKSNYVVLMAVVWCSTFQLVYTWNINQ